MGISSEFSRSVYEDSLSAFRDSEHPCKSMVDWQATNGYSPFQLSEPFSGRESKLGIAFMGLNPSVAKDEDIPTTDKKWHFKNYDSFYRSRFDAENRDQEGKLVVSTTTGKSHKVRLWNNIELFGNNYLAENENIFRLGEDAFLIEAIRYKSTKGWIGKNAKDRKHILEHETCFTQKLLDEKAFSILVPMGNKALHQVRNILDFKISNVPSTVGRAMGNTYVGETPSKTQVIVCPIKHMSYPPKHDLQKAVAKEILEAIRNRQEFANEA